MSGGEGPAAALPRTLHQLKHGCLEVPMQGWRNDPVQDASQVPGLVGAGKRAQHRALASCQPPPGRTRAPPSRLRQRQDLSCSIPFLPCICPCTASPAACTQLSERKPHCILQEKMRRSSPNPPCGAVKPSRPPGPATSPICLLRAGAEPVSSRQLPPCSSQGARLYFEPCERN